MGWDGGKYEVDQGVAFAKAAQRIETLKQVVYGTAPARKWPEEYRVEPPIHYAAKWRIEEILLDAGLPLTALRKCPYHENFTKLTKPEKRTDGEGDGNWWEPGTYFIKALTPSDFEYNMLGPGDIGAWALLALEVSSSKHAPSMQQSTLLPFLPPFPDAGPHVALSEGHNSQYFNVLCGTKTPV